jgi:hypothetical protein
MTKELSPLARQIMGHANVMPMFTQREFDKALAEAKAEIMVIAIEATKQAHRHRARGVRPARGA